MKQIVTDTTTAATTATATINQSNVHLCLRQLMRIKFQSEKKITKYLIIDETDAGKKHYFVYA